MREIVSASPQFYQSYLERGMNKGITLEGLTLETSAFLAFTVANLRFQPSC